jgi:hypothetical protein
LTNNIIYGKQERRPLKEIYSLYNAIKDDDKEGKINKYYYLFSAFLQAVLDRKP